MIFGEISIFSLFIILIPTPDFTHFFYMFGGNLGSLLYGDVSVMTVFLPGLRHLEPKRGMIRLLSHGYHHCSVSIFIRYETFPVLVFSIDFVLYSLCK